MKTATITTTAEGFEVVCSDGIDGHYLKADWQSMVKWLNGEGYDVQGREDLSCGLHLTGGVKVTGWNVLVPTEYAVGRYLYNMPVDKPKAVAKANEWNNIANTEALVVPCEQIKTWEG